MVEICLSIVVVIAMIINAVLLYNFMQLLSTLNKRLVMIIGDILENANLSSEHIDTLDPTPNQNDISIEDVLPEESINGFNPHNYDPFKEDNE